MSTINNINSFPKEFTDDPEFKSPLMTKYLSGLAGSENMYVNIDYLKPGAKSTKFHSHTLKEEFFLILRGTGSLRIGDKILPVKQGDFFAKPAGKNLAHQFVNDSETTLEILDCGLNNKNDVVEYPDEGTILVKGKAYTKSSQIEDWSSNPNE